MKAVLVPGTVITNKKQALDYIKRISLDIHSFEDALAVDQIVERLVATRLIDWSEVS